MGTEIGNTLVLRAFFVLPLEALEGGVRTDFEWIFLAVISPQKIGGHRKQFLK